VKAFKTTNYCYNTDHCEKL